ncbi:acyltransferase family protein [Parasediminibacterium sp. JCM 36343]|uniref:acyltransferase family protein n=1 Tax=Parasediminibacterium sp. JCM 36343 TaxID=3374279 RepID=UPI003979DE95
MTVLLFVHNYNFAPFVTTPSTLVTSSFSISNFIEYLFSNSVFRFRIGLLMIISGYLLGNHSYVPYRALMTKKIKTLVVPYLLVSFISFLIIILIEIIFIGIHSSHGILGKNIAQFTVKDYFFYIFLSPLPFQLWYLKSIFMMTALSPVIRWLLQKMPLQTFLIMFAIWMFTNYLDGETRDRAFIFYIFGYYIGMSNKDISKPISFLNPKTALSLFVAISFLRTGLAFLNPHIFFNVKYVLIMLFKVNEIVGAYAVWFCFDDIINWVDGKKWYKTIVNSSFFIYAFHAPLLNFMSDIAMKRNIPHLILYIGLPALLLPLLIGTDILIRNNFAKFYSVLTGGRNALENAKKQKRYFLKVVSINAAA